MGIPFTGLSTLIGFIVMTAAWLFIHNRIHASQAVVSRPVRLLHNFFLQMGIFFLIMGLPHIWLYVAPQQFSEVMAWGYTIGHVFLYISLTYIARMACTIVPRLVDKEIYVILGGIVLNVAITLVTTMTMIFGVQPVYDYATNVTQFNAAPIVGASIGLCALLSMLPASVLFLIAAFKSHGSRRMRPLLLGIGLAILTVAGPLHDTAVSLHALVAADLATILGIIILGGGVVYRLEQSLVIRPAASSAPS